MSVDPDRLDEVASLFQRASHDCGTVFNNLNMTLHALEGEWKGNAAARFFHEFAPWQPTTRQFVELLDSVALHLKQVAEHQRSTEATH